MGEREYWQPKGKESITSQRPTRNQIRKAIETCLLCELKLIDIWIFLSIEINVCHSVSEISNTQDFVTFYMRRFPSRNASSANTTRRIKSLRDFQSKGREHQLKIS